MPNHELEQIADPEEESDLEPEIEDEARGTIQRGQDIRVNERNQSPSNEDLDDHGQIRAARGSAVDPSIEKRGDSSRGNTTGRPIALPVDKRAGKGSGKAVR